MFPGSHARRSPGKAAVICGSADEMTYEGLERSSDALARAWRARGIMPGDVVAIVMSNDSAFFTVAWAAQRSGLYYVALSTHSTPDELAYLIADCGPKCVVVDAALADRVGHEFIVVHPAGAPGLPSLRDLIEGAPDVAYDRVEGSDMLYTSGTTGRPKGVKPPLDFRPLGSDERRVERARTLYGFDEDSVFLVPAPAYHAAPLRFAMTALRLGATVVLLEKFSPEGALDALVRHGVTHSQWVPTMFGRMLALPDDRRAAFCAPSHRLAMHSGAPCALDVKRRMIAWWGPILYEYYSGSESVGFTHVDSAQWLARPGTVGKAYGCTVHVLDDGGAEVAPGQVGSVYFESGHRLAYHNDAGKTRDAIDRRGWATMGDLGYLDEDGFLFLTDRKAFTIVSGGVNIYPREVEAALETHRDVLEAAVFGLPDGDFGERVHAVVAVSEERRADPKISTELIEHARRLLSPYKLPKAVDVRDELPHLGSGKLDKRRLRGELLALTREKVH